MGDARKELPPASFTEPGARTETPLAAFTEGVDALSRSRVEGMSNLARQIISDDRAIISILDMMRTDAMSKDDMRGLLCDAILALRAIHRARATRT